MHFNPWVGKVLWRRKWQPTPVFLPEKFHGQRNLVGYSPWGHKESDTTVLGRMHPQWFNNNALPFSLIRSAYVRVEEGGKCWHRNRGTKDIAHLLPDSAQYLPVGTGNMRAMLLKWTCDLLCKSHSCELDIHLVGYGHNTGRARGRLVPCPLKWRNLGYIPKRERPMPTQRPSWLIDHWKSQLDSGSSLSSVSRSLLPPPGFLGHLHGRARKGFSVLKESWGWDKLGDEDWRIYTIDTMYKTDN